MAKQILIFLSFSCLAVCRYGSTQDQGVRGCDVGVMVRRGTAYYALPQDLVEAQCPVQHCGHTVHIIWCRWMDPNICAKLNSSEHIQINETRLPKKLVSVLRFKRISTEDSGVYFCKELNYGSVGHLINVTVSETNQGDQKNDGNSGQGDLNSPTEAISFVYFVILLILVLVLLTITAVVFLRKYRKGSSQQQLKTQEEQLPSQMIPDLPKRSSPVPLKSLSISVVVPPPAVPEKTRTRPVQSSESPVYSQLDRTKSRKSFQSNPSGRGTSTNTVDGVDISESGVDVNI